jgi:hypothetical protein
MSHDADSALLANAARWHEMSVENNAQKLSAALAERHMFVSDNCPCHAVRFVQHALLPCGLRDARVSV